MKKTFIILLLILSLLLGSCATNISNEKKFKNPFLVMDTWKDFYLYKEDIKTLTINHVVWIPQQQTYLFVCHYYKKIVGRNQEVTCYLPLGNNLELHKIIMSGKYKLQVRRFIFMNGVINYYPILKKTILRKNTMRILTPEEFGKILESK